jgi:acetyl esterase/lipase
MEAGRQRRHQPYKSISDEQFLKLDAEIGEVRQDYPCPSDADNIKIFKRYGVPKLPLPTRTNVQLLRKGYSKALARFNRSPFVAQALGIANGPPSWTEHNVRIPVRDGSNINACIYRPQQLPTSGAPVAAFFHGGGWFAGTAEDEAFLCRLLATRFGHVVLNVEYRLHPDVNFPVPALDAYDAVKWTISHVKQFGGDLAKGFLVGGTSGGATFAAISAHLARDEKLSPPITGCFLFCPVIPEGILVNENDLISRFPGRNRSPDQNANAPLMTRAMQQSIMALADFDWQSPLISPLMFPDHHELPPTWVSVCGLDPWRDGGIIYAEEIEKEGTKVRVDAYPGLPHCWWTNFPQIEATRKWLQDVLEGFEWLVGADTAKSHL